MILLKQQKSYRNNFSSLFMALSAYSSPLWISIHYYNKNKFTILVIESLPNDFGNELSFREDYRKNIINPL